MYLYAGLQLVMAFTAAFFKGIRQRISKDSARKWFCISCGIILSLIVGLRNQTMGDMPGYIYGFELVSAASFRQVLTMGVYNFERGFIIFNKLLSYICADSQILVLGCAMLAIIPFAVWIYRKSAEPFLSFVLLVGMPSFLWVYSAMRQMSAIGICVFALEAVQDRKWKKFILMVLVASLFHYSAIIFIIVYPVYWFRTGKAGRKLSIAVILLVYAFRYPLFMILKHVLHKDSYTADSNNAIMLFLVYCAIYVFCTIFGREDENQNGLLNVFFLACLTQAMGGVNMEVGRTTWYYAIPMVILIPEIVSSYQDVITKRTLYLGIWTCFALYSVVTFTGNNMIHNGTNYFFWMG